MRFAKVSLASGCGVVTWSWFDSDGMVKFMVDALNKAGCPWDPDKFTCITCDAPVEAGADSTAVPAMFQLCCSELGFDKSNDSVSSISPQCVLLTVGLPVRLKFVGTM